MDLDAPASSFGSAPPRDFNNLPAELKAEVVSICAKQDEAFRDWLSVEGREGLVQELVRTDSMFGRSVSALFQVDKALSELAAKHLFKVHLPFLVSL
jgi:hypothetical protein